MRRQRKRSPRASGGRLTTGSWWAGAALLTLVAPFFATGHAMASASNHHYYSVAFETTNGGFTGVSDTRVDMSVTVPPDGCQALLGPHAMYQSMWIADGAAHAGMNDWLELGTGHQCADNWRFHYWGYAINGAWSFIGHVNISGNDMHNYDKISDFKIDGQVKDSFYWDRMFHDDSAGLESYAEFGDANPHTYHHLQYQRMGNSTWQDWDGTDASILDDPPMCGIWNGPQSWLAGEANSC